MAMEVWVLKGLHLLTRKNFHEWAVHLHESSFAIAIDIGTSGQQSSTVAK